MTTYFNFTPSATQTYQFQPTLDGQVYTCTVQWNRYRQGYYVLCVDLSGNLVFNIPMAASGLNTDLSLSAPFGFASTLVFRGPNNQFEVSP